LIFGASTLAAGFSTGFEMAASLVGDFDLVALGTIGSGFFSFFGAFFLVGASFVAFCSFSFDTDFMVTSLAGATTLGTD
jgi:hypothetical protein